MRNTTYFDWIMICERTYEVDWLMGIPKTILLELYGRPLTIQNANASVSEVF